MNLIDLNSGKTYTDDDQNEGEPMQVTLKQKVLNQMFFQDLSLNSTMRILSQSRYLFIEFIPEFSMVLVGN